MSAQDKTRLFIGQLPSEITSEELEEHFGQYGEIKDVFLPKSNKSKRIAFITFVSDKSLYAALAEKKCVFHGVESHLTQALPKGSSLPGNPNFGMTHGRNSSTGGFQASTRIFLNNIPDGTTSDELTDFFGEFGEVTDVFYKVTNPFGFVTFGSETDMYKALARDPMIFKGAELKAEVAKPKPQRGGPGMGAPQQQQQAYGGGYQQQQQAFSPYGAPAAPVSNRRSEPNARLFVGGLNHEVTDEAIKNYFSQFGEISDFFRPAGKSGGSFGFVTYEDTHSMFAALACPSHVLEGVELRVTEADPKPPKPGMSGGGYGAPSGGGYGGGAPSYNAAPSRGGGGGGGGKEYRIFVGSISPGIIDADIQTHFAQFGDIADVYRPGKQKAARDGSEFGFVIFDNQHAMAKALAQPGHNVNGCDLMVTRARERPQGGGGGGGGSMASAPPPAQLAYNPLAYDQQYGYAAQAQAQQVYNPYLSAPGYAQQVQQQAYPAADSYQAYPTSTRGKPSSRYQPY